MSRNFTTNQAIQQMAPQSFQDRTDDPWQKYYGQNPYYTPETLDPEAKKLTVAPDMPVAYIGKNIYIPSLVEELVYTTDNWYTKVALPLEKTDQITWSFNITTFDQRMPRNTPHKATSRVLDSRSTTKSGKMERHGIAYEMEANFMDTPEGRQHYYYTLNQMANSIILLLNVGVIQALLNAGGYQRAWEETHGMRIANDVITRMEREVEMFAIVQKEKLGLPRLNVKVSEWMKSYQGEGNMWIMPPQVQAYESLVPPENTNFFISGRRIFDPNDSVDNVYRLGGLPVYLCRIIDNVFEFGQRNLLARTVEIGSYNTMLDPNKNESDSYFLEKYQSNHRSIKVYDENMDEYVILGLDFALENSHVFDRQTGEPFLPKNNRLYNSNPKDKNYDMLSYVDDDDPNVRKPAKLFGHVPADYFSTPSVVNLARTVTKYHSSKTNMSYGKMEDVLNSGLALVEKMNNIQIDLPWFFNVFTEHLIRNGITGTEDLSNADAYKAYIKKITKMARRTTNTMRVIKGTLGNGLSLPKYDYYSALLKEFEFKESERLAGRAGYVITTATLERRASRENLFGGGSRGALAGFGSWDGFLMLQEEFNGGPGSFTGYTKNGYSVKDCKVASKFVDLVRRLVKTSTFLFDNAIFLNSSSASSLIEEPSVEHVVAESLLGMTGIPLFLDVTKMNAMKAPASRGIVGQGVNLGLKDTALAFVNTMDRENLTNLNAIKAFATKESKTPAEGAIIVKMLNVLFDPVRLSDFHNGGNAGLDTASDNFSGQIGVFVTHVFPFSNLNFQTITYRAFVLRSMLLDLMIKFIVGSGGEKEKKGVNLRKVQLLSEFLKWLLTTTNLVKLMDLIPDWPTFKVVVEGLRDTEGAQEIADLPTSIQGTPWFDRNDYAPITFKAIADWFVSKFPSNKALISFLQSKAQEYSEAENQDESSADAKNRNTGAPLNRPPIVFMMNINDKDLTDGDTIRGLDRENFPQGPQGGARAQPGGASLFVRGIYSDPMEDESFFEGPGGPGEVVYGGERYFRSPLVVSAKQAVQIFDLLGRDDTLDTAMNLRLADPDDIERYVDPSRTKSLLKRIKEVNKNASDNFSAPGGSESANLSSAYESPLLYFPENIKGRERAIALSLFGSGKMGQSSFEGDVYGRASGRKRSFQSSATGYGSRGDERPNKKRRTSSAYGLNLVGIGRSRDFSGLYENDEDDGDGGGFDPRRGDVRLGDDYEIVDEDSDEEPTVRRRKTTNLASARKQLGGNENEEINSNVLSIFVSLSDTTPSRLLIMFSKIYLTSYMTKNALLKFCKNDILVPFNVLLFRPHMRYESNTAIKMQAGSDTGKTFIGHTGLALQNDAQTKTHHGHMTFYDESIVFKDKNVFVQPNVFISGCLGGAGFSPMNPRYYNPRSGETGGGEVICVLIPYEETEFPVFMDVTGRYYASTHMNFVDKEKMDLPHYSQCWRANQIWQFRSTDQIGGDEISYNDGSKKRFSNTVVVKAQQFNYDVGTASFSRKISNKGHWGDEAPGSKIGRNGGLRTLVKHPTISIA